MANMSGTKLLLVMCVLSVISMAVKSEDRSLGSKYEEIDSMAEFIKSKTSHRPTIGIICGTGLGCLADTLEDKFILPHEDLPGFPISTVEGYSGQLVLGKLRGKTVICSTGRLHFYEGHSIWKVIIPVRVMAMLGVTTVFDTNAAGGINRSYNVGDVMIIKDHINFAGMAGVNPLIGLNDERFGPRFPDMSDAYDVNLRKLAKELAEKLGFQSFIREGVYCMLSGPSFETPAEVRFLNTIGADVVGMSTCISVIGARHCGMKVLGISFISNMCILDSDAGEILTTEEIMEVHSGIHEKSLESLQNLVAELVEKL